MQNKKGFTLIELMITVALLAILATVAIPSFQNSIYRNYSETAAAEMAALVRMARSEALVRASDVRICDADNLDNNFCKEAGNDWQGQVVVTAPKQDGTGNETLAVIESGSQILATAANNLDQSITFDLQGRLVEDTRILTMCDKKNVACRTLSISPRGKTKVVNSQPQTSP